MRFFKKIFPFLIFTALLAVPPFWLKYTPYYYLLIPQFWVLFAFVGGLTFAALSSVLLAQNANPETYTQIFMGATVFKLLACLVFVLVFIIKIKVNKPFFMVDLLYLYFLNTGFEIYVLLCNLRNQKLE